MDRLTTSRAIQFSGAFGVISLGLLVANFALDYVTGTTKAGRGVEIEEKFKQLSNQEGLYARDKGPERIESLEKAVAAITEREAALTQRVRDLENAKGRR